MYLMTKATLDSIYAACDADMRAAFATVCILGGAVSPAHFAYQCEQGRNAALDRGNDHWAGVYARLRGLAA
jgi:hypothetical protein